MRRILCYFKAGWERRCWAKEAIGVKARCMEKRKILLIRKEIKNIDFSTTFNNIGHYSGSIEGRVDVVHCSVQNFK